MASSNLPTVTFCGHVESTKSAVEYKAAVALFGVQDLMHYRFNVLAARRYSDGSWFFGFFFPKEHQFVVSLSCVKPTKEQHQRVINSQCWWKIPPCARLMSSVPQEGRCDRFGSRCGVIGTIKEEKQEIWCTDKLNKQADGKEKHRRDSKREDK